MAPASALQSWSNEDENLLKDLIRNEKSLSEIYTFFPSRSESAIRSKINKLRHADRSLPRPSATRAHWTAEEDRILKEKFAEGFTYADILPFLPGRSLRAISQRLQPLLTTQRLQKVEVLPWSETLTKGIAEIPPANWPIQRVISDKSIFAMMHPGILTNLTWMVSLLRDLLTKAENLNKSRINFIYAENKQQLVEKLDNSRTVGTRRISSPFIRKLIYASLLADGCLIQPKANFYNTVFQFTQAANLMSRTGESHLEYACWFLEQMNFDILTSTPFSLNRGIPVKSPKEGGLKYTWKARVWLWNVDIFPEAFEDNYKGFCEDRSREEEFIQFTSSGSLTSLLKDFPSEELMGSVPQYEDLDPEVDDFDMVEELVDMEEDVSEEIDFLSSNTLPRKLKNLPPYDKLKNVYLEDPGLTMAHMHMQDGDLFSISSSVSIPRLYIQTTDPIQTLYLSKAIFETLGLKYLPISYYYPTKKKKIVTVLYLCPSSVNRFIESMEQHMLPCMKYKNPPRLEMKNPSIAQVLKDFDERFDDFARKFF